MVPYSQLCFDDRDSFCTKAPSAYRLTVASAPPPDAESGTELRTTRELAAFVEVNSTYWLVEVSRTDLRPEDSVAKLVCPKVRWASVVRRVPVYRPSSASYSV